MNGDLSSVWDELRSVRSQLRDHEREIAVLRAQQDEARLRRVQFPVWLGLVISALMGGILFVTDKLLQQLWGP